MGEVERLSFATAPAATDPGLLESQGRLVGKGPSFGRKRARPAVRRGLERYHCFLPFWPDAQTSLIHAAKPGAQWCVY